MTNPTFLLSPPKNFTVDYEINVWMDKNNKPDQLAASTQWHCLTQTIWKVGGKTKFTPEYKHPDSVFAANAGIAFPNDNIFIPAKFKHPERQVEEKDWHSYFITDMGWEVWHLPDGVVQEGAGDALFMGNTLVTGYGFRSTEESCNVLRSIFETDKKLSKYGIMKVQLVDERFYHLDTCFCPLDAKTALYYPGAFSKESDKALNDRFRMIAVREQDALKYACNSIVIGQNVLMPYLGDYQEQLQMVKTLNMLGFGVQFVQMSEYMKSGGACKCLTLRIA